MRKLICLAALILLPAIAFAQPSIVFDTEKHDFGTVERGKTLEFSFEFRNEGKDDLIIKRVSPS